jgi:cytosine/adenosine deaminase-related metal-dependent hydrolase
LTIISADYILVCDSEFKVLQNHALCFDEVIKEIALLEVLTSKYPEAKVIELQPNSVIMPGLINPHVHLEFSANSTTLRYGDFITWLNSVIQHRDELSSRCDEKYIDRVLKDMLLSGTTTIGAVSSFGVDMNSCIKTPISVVYFNEVLGSNPAAVDALYNDFLGRLYESMQHADKNFTPAISIHSPYSTHPILAKKALKVAKEQGVVVSTHFMESQAERDWLDHARGEFKEFFEKFAPNSKPVNEPIEYIELFKDQKVLFTHATVATKEELELMDSIGFITHCPVSNRLLGNGRLAIEEIKNLTIATDGLSSNNSLNMWDELRAALMMHFLADINELAKRLLISATSNGAKALNMNSGELTEGRDADMIVLKLPDSLKNPEEIAIFLILHTKKVDKVFIKGEEVI